MTTVVKLKRSETAFSEPDASDLAVGELAVNLADAKLFSKSTAGNIVSLGQEDVTSYWLNGDLGSITENLVETFDLGEIDQTDTDISITVNNLDARAVETTALKIGTQVFPQSDGSSGQVITTDGNGSLSWTNQTGSGGSSYADSDVDSHLNQNNPTSGYVLSWNGSDYAWVDNAGFTSSDVDSHLNQNNPTSGYVLSWNGSDYAWVAQTGGGGGGSYADSDVDSHLNQNNPTSGYVLSWNGSDYAWVAQTGGSGSGLSAWAEKTSDYTASAGDRLIVDVSSSEVTITLPASPSLGDEVAIIDGSSSAETNNITIARNGEKIDGSDSDLTIDVNGAATNLVYYNTDNGWIFSER